jgi:hypothetical protein
MPEALAPARGPTTLRSAPNTLAPERIRNALDELSARRGASVEAPADREALLDRLRRHETKAAG